MRIQYVSDAGPNVELVLGKQISSIWLPYSSFRESRIFASEVRLQLLLLLFFFDSFKSQILLTPLVSFGA